MNEVGKEGMGEEDQMKNGLMNLPSSLSVLERLPDGVAHSWHLPSERLSNQGTGNTLKFGIILTFFRGTSSKICYHKV